MSITIEEANKNSPNGPDYYLVEWQNGEREYLYSYGKKRPTFRHPNLINGLCENYLTGIDDGSIDLLIDDPPYGTTNAQWDNEPDWDRITELYGRALADDGTLVMFGKQPSLIPVYNAFTNDGFEFRFELIWKKQNNPWVSDYQPIPIHENIFVFKKRGTKVSDLTFNIENIKRDGIFVCPRCEDEINKGSYSVTRTNDGKSETQGGWQEVYEASGGEDRYPISFIDRDILEFTSVVGAHDEYTGYAGQKPVDLLSWLVLAMSDRGDTILDPHMGSGSTPMACIPLCRESIGVEVDPDRFKTAEKRINGFISDLSGLKHAKVSSEKKKINLSIASSPQ